MGSNITPLHMFMKLKQLNIVFLLRAGIKMIEKGLMDSVSRPLGVL